MNTLFLLLAVISLLSIPIFFILALFSLIRKKPAKKRFKWAGISALVFVSSLVGFGFTMEPPVIPESIELSIPNYQTEYGINTEIPISITVFPEHADTSSLEYIASGNTLTFSKSSINTGSVEGSFDIYVKYDDTISNTLSINVTDINAREKALELAAAEAEKQRALEEEEQKRLDAEKAAAEAEQKRLEEEKAAKEAEQKRLAEEKAAQEAEQKRLAIENMEDIPSKTTSPLTSPSESKVENENPLGFNVDFSKTYRNDVTGNWRLARIAENINIEEYALDYYKNYFEADNEIHIIINFSLNTTTRIMTMGNLLDVTTMEYVKKEEHDAALACSGMLLSEYHVNIDTGEVEKIQ